MRGNWLASLSCFAVLLAISPSALRAVTPQTAFDSGDFTDASVAWNQIVLRDLAAHDLVGAARALANQAAAQESLGDYPSAITCLEKSVALNGDSDPSLRIALADAYALARTDAMGMSYLPAAQQQLDVVRETPELRADIQSADGAIDLARQQPWKAIGYFENALSAAQSQHDSSRVARAAANSAVACLAVARSPADAAGANSIPENNEVAMAASGGRSDNEIAWQAAVTLPANHATAFLWLTIGQNDEGLADFPPSEPNLRLAAYASYQQALKIADANGDDLIRSYALGYTGHLYELDGRTAEAEQLTQQALFIAQQLRRPELLYLWQWQTGRLLRASGDRDGAIAAYYDAATSLRAIQTDLSAGGGNSPGGVSFRQTAGDVFYQLADLLLQRADDDTDPADQQQTLSDARDTVENLKTAELQNYFQDRCERLLEKAKKGIETIDPHTAVVYFVPLPDRVEILVGVSDARAKTGGKPIIARFRTKISADELTATARRFRVEVRDQSSEEYFKDGQQLYQWLIAPIEPFLAQHGAQSSEQTIDTLVFVPDGALRAIPMSALADANGQFLIQKYAVAVSPGLQLTDLSSGSQDSGDRSGTARVLISGLSVARNGFPALRYVSEEVQQINSSYGGRGETLLNDKFVAAQVNNQLQSTDYSIVHIASHGHFGGNASDTYVMDFDGPLDLDDLERLIEPSKYRQRPVDLLTLSACETAAGDDRAALGLAGVAVKAGALSAMATLWAVNDRSCAILVPDFYAHLSRPGFTKARALQAAQLELLTNPQFKAYRHPYFWSPYLIVGNWL